MLDLKARFYRFCFVFAETIGKRKKNLYQTSAETLKSYSNGLAENIYDEAYQREEQSIENDYRCSEPQWYGT